MKSRRGVLGSLLPIVLIAITLLVGQRYWSSLRPDIMPRSAISNFRLVDQRNEGFELYRNAHAKAVVIVSHGLDCPDLVACIAALQRLRLQYEPRGVVFALLNAQDERLAVARETRRDGIGLPVLMDEGQLISRDLGFQRTAEAVVIVPKDWRIVYRGAIDGEDGPGGQASARLKDAIDAIVNGDRVEVATTQSRGSTIRYRSQPNPSYAHDVIPLLKMACLDCHGDKESSPCLNTFEQIRRFAPMIRETLLAQRMPPWTVDPQYGSFVSQGQSLSVEQRSLLVAWLDHGLQRDGGEDPLTVKPATSSRPRPSAPDFEWKMPLQHIPPQGEIPYRFFQVVGPLKKEWMISGMRLTAFDGRIIHHAKLCISTLPLSALKADSRTMGFDHYPDDKVAAIFTVSARSQASQASLEGSAWYAPKGSYLLLEVHYTATGKAERNQTGLQLWYYRQKNKPVPLKRILITNPSFTIPARAPHVVVDATKTLDRDYIVLGMTLHMHRRGQSIWMRAEYPDGRKQMLISQPFYDADGQGGFQLEAPKLLRAGTRILVRGVFNNSQDNQNNPDPNREVKAGLNTTTNEMLKARLIVLELPRSHQAQP